MTRSARELMEPLNTDRRPMLHRRGLTLIEVVISIVLVSTVLLVSLAASANLLRNSNGRRDLHRGQRLAAQMVDEVTAMEFRDRDQPIFGLETGELLSDRTTFDDVDDYSGYVQSPPTSRDNTVLEAYQGWTVSIDVDPADWVLGGLSTAAADVDSSLRRITVSCTSPDGVMTDATALVADINRDTEETTSYERWRRIQLTFPDREVEVVSPMRNEPDPTY